MYTLKNETEIIVVIIIGVIFSGVGIYLKKQCLKIYEEAKKTVKSKMV